MSQPYSAWLESVFNLDYIVLIYVFLSI